MKTFINYAHRGASEYAPENTLQSFYLGLQMQANGIETDVQMTKDNVAVLFHDDTLFRVTGEQGSVKDYTLSELNAFWVKKNGHQDKIITLRRFFECFSDRNITFAIELKGENTERATLDLINEFNLLDKVIITSFKFDYLKKFRALCPTAKIGYLVSQVTPEVLSDLASINGYEICPEAQSLTKEKVKSWHNLGLNVRAWGVYNPKLMKHAFRAGVDGMTVNFPDKLTKLLKGKKFGQF
jgi:glycerophosphoryl diester phosphodiesterase